MGLRTIGSITDGLAGLGFHWLKKAQPHLAIVHVEDRSSSSAASNGRPTTTELPYSQADDDADALRAANEAEDRVQTAHYVEARGLLVPATDFFARAVEVADEEDGVTGELLVLVSECFVWKPPDPFPPLAIFYLHL